MSTFWYKDVFLRRYFFRSSVAHNNKRRTGPKWGGIDVGSEKREENKKKVEEEEEERKGKRRRRCVQWPDGTSWVESSRHFSCVRPSLSFLTWRVDDDVTRTADRQQHAFFGCWFPMTRRAALSKAELHAASQQQQLFIFLYLVGFFNTRPTECIKFLNFRVKWESIHQLIRRFSQQRYVVEERRGPFRFVSFFFPQTKLYVDRNPRNTK